MIIFMHLKSIGNTTTLSKSFNSLIASGVKGNLQLATSLMGVDTQTKIAIVSQSNLTETQKIGVLATSGLTAEELKQAVANNTLSTSQTTTTATTTGLTNAFRGLWATLKANPLILIATVATIGITILDKYKNHLEEVRQEAEQSASTYKESASSIDDYVSRYQDLQKTLQDAKGNEEQTATVKQQLLDLQTELNSKFGEEAKAINLVTGEYEKQIEAIRALNKEEANKFLNENRKGIATATKKMEKDKTYSLSYGTVSAYTDEGKALQDIASSYANKGMVVNTDEATGIMTITLKADAQTAYDTINDFETDLRNKAKDLGNEKLFDSVFTVSSDALNDAKSVVDDYGEIYNQALMAKLVTDGDLSATYNEALNAVEDYNEALVTGENVAEAKKNLDDVKAKIEGNSETWGKYASITEDLFAQAGADISNYADTVTDTMGKVEEATKFTKTQMIDTINSMSDGFDVLDDIYADVLDGGTFDFTKLDTSKFSEAFSEIIPEYEKFIETVSASPTDIEACQGAFNDLVGAFIDSKGVLEGVDEETKQLTIDMLENMGVVNAEEVVMSSMGMAFENYALAKQEASNAGINLMNATDAEIQQLLLEDSTSRQTAQGLFLYQMQKALSNATTLQTFGDIENLKALGLSLGLTSDLLDDFIRLIQIKNDISLASQLGDRDTVNVLTAEAEALTASIKEQASSFKTAYTPIANYGGASKTAAVAQDKLKDSTKKATDALEKQKEKLEETKSKYETLFDAVDYFYQKQEDKIDKQIDGLQDVNEQLEKQLNNLDGIMSAMDLVYESEIKNLKAQQDAIDDAVDGKEKELAVENALKKLREANSRKVLGVYEKGKGIVYKNDEKAISEAMDEYEQANAEKAKADIQDKIDLIESYRDRLNEIPKAWEKAYNAQLAYERLGSGWQEAILNPSDDLFNNLESDYSGIQGNIVSNDSKIDKLEKEKEHIQELRKLWEEAKNEYKYAEYEKMLSTFIGSDYEYQLLNNSAVWRRKFADEYSSICAEIEALEERIKTSSETTTSSVESGANRISNAANGVKGALENTGNISKYIWTEADTAALEFAKGRLDALNTLIGQGRTELTDARDKVADFVEQYAQLEDSRIVTDNLKSSVSDLNGIYSETDTLFNDVLEGVDGRLSNMSSYVQEVDSSSQTLADNLSTASQAIQEMKTSEETIEAEAEETVSNVEITISNLLTKLGELQTKLGEISLFRTEVEAIADEELLDTSTVVDGVHTKVGEIQNAITTLMESITPLEGALDALMQKLTTLDEITLSNVISAFGGASGGEGGESKESGYKSSSKGKKGSEGESGGGTGLLGAIKAVDEAIGSVDNEESLLGKLAQVDASTLENIIAQFGLGGENGDSEGANLLNAVNAVSTAIVGGGKDDENSLIASIEQLGSDPTIEHVTTVSDSFQTLHDTINECVKKVEELSKAIESIPSSTATVGVNGGKSSGRAKGGIITKKDAGDFDYIARELGEDHMIAIQEGEAVIPKETVAKNPEAIDSLLSGKKLDLKALVNRDIVLQRATPLDTYSMFEKYKDWIIPDSLIMSRLNLPSQDFSKLGVVNNNQQQTVIQINGDLSFPNIKSGNDAELLLNDLSNMANKARQRSARR